MGSKTRNRRRRPSKALQQEHRPPSKNGRNAKESAPRRNPPPCRGVLTPNDHWIRHPSRSTHAPPPEGSCYSISNSDTTPFLREPSNTKKLLRYLSTNFGEGQI